MAAVDLTQSEADALLQMAKTRVDDRIWDYPGTGGEVRIPLSSFDGKEQFHLDIRRARIDLTKGKYQSRARYVVVLARLDFGGSPHRNPDGEEVPSPHLHLYREGFGTKWAWPIPLDDFPHIDDLWQTLQDFMLYCHITKVPHIHRDLFT